MVRDRVDGVGTVVAQDGRVDAVCEADISEVGVRPNPVVVHRLIRRELKEVPSDRTTTSSRKFH